MKFIKFGHRVAHNGELMPGMVRASAVHAIYWGKIGDNTWAVECVLDCEHGGAEKFDSMDAAKDRFYELLELLERAKTD